MELSPEEVALRIQGAEARIATVEGGLRDTTQGLVHHQTELVNVNGRHVKLLEDLRGEFTRLRSELNGQVEALRLENKELRDALPALASGGAGPAGLRLVDTRIIDKPKPFHGQDSQWRDWSEAFQSFCSAADEGMGKDMETWSKKDMPVLHADMSEPQRSHSRQLNHMLVMLLKGKSVELRRGVIEKGNGLEVWRALYVEHEPQVKNRHAGILGTILSTHFKGTIGYAEFAAWSSLIREYESTSKDVVADNIRHATILNGMGECPLKEHLQLNGDKYPTSEDLLKGIETYFQSLSLIHI